MQYRNYFTLGIFLILSLIHRNIVAQDFEVAPVFLEFNAEPGENQSRTITVKNHSNKKSSFLITLNDFLPSSTGEKKVLAPNSTKRSCANWLNINPSFFEINPGDEISIQLNMMVPTDEYSAAWCILYIQTTIEQSSWTSDKSLGTGVRVGGRIGVHIYQSPKSNSKYALKISNLIEITEAKDKERRFSATIENLGEKITKSKVYLIASNINNVEEKQFDPIEFETFPKMSRTIELILPNVLASGTYSLAAIIDYGSKFALEGTQILIEVKDYPVILHEATVDSMKVK
ncbi:MAG: hypothetical protein EHM93_16750 [Bacteroidales bacterium]|nr:MAG: hypothetical protein EHM93_16750 [Bacteroidales bacterium]